MNTIVRAVTVALSPASGSITEMVLSAIATSGRPADLAVTLVPSQLDAALLGHLEKLGVKVVGRERRCRVLLAEFTLAVEGRDIAPCPALPCSILKFE